MGETPKLAPKLMQFPIHLSLGKFSRTDRKLSKKWQL